MKDINKALGILSALGTFGVLVFIAVKSQAIGIVGNEFLTFLFGGVNEIVINDTTFLMMLTVISAVVVFQLPSAVIAGILQEKILGKQGKHALLEFFERMGNGNHFFTFFILVLLEELFARWLFLGLLTKVPFLSGTIAFYALFLIGNGLWALIHLKNFKDKKDQKILRILPQFVSGVFFTYVFVKYGLLAVVLTHFASNAVLLASHRLQRIKIVNVLIIGYSVICASVSYWLMDKPITDIFPWFVDDSIFVLAGWDFWDYVKISVFLSSCFTVIFGVLLYDRVVLSKHKSGKEFTVVNYFFATFFLVGILYGLYALLGLAVASVPYRILLLAILVTFLQKGSSGSAIARSFWVGLPSVYIMMCIFQALGFWFAVVYLFIGLIIELPIFVLLKKR